jgi:hypothetical protein
MDGTARARVVGHYSNSQVPVQMRMRIMAIGTRDRRGSPRRCEHRTAEK